jgi:hypothetical protein
MVQATVPASSGHIESAEKGKQPKDVQAQGSAQAKTSASQAGLLSTTLRFTTWGERVQETEVRLKFLVS